MEDGRERAPILCVVGARPNFMKIAPILRAMQRATPPLPFKVVHTGQHYDPELSGQFFEALDLPEPDINLEVGSASHAVQTAEIMRRFEPVVERERPVAVLVVGDVNSTLACALVASKKLIPVVHVEAGLRSYDRAMPEEINRVLTDQIADLLFLTEKSARENLLREGIADSRIHFVGNVMIDTLRHNLKRRVLAKETLGRHCVPEDVSKRGYAVLTMHRPSNVDDPVTLVKLLNTIRDIAARLPVVFPVHPRTRAKIQQYGLGELLGGPSVWALPSLGYLEMLGLLQSARLVLTDSGGIQEETTALGVPCLTLRENTERPITIKEGTNTLVGNEPERILSAVDEICQNGGNAGRVPDLWDGFASERIVAVLSEWRDSSSRGVMVRAVGSN